MRKKGYFYFKNSSGIIKAAIQYEVNENDIARYASVIVPNTEVFDKNEVKVILQARLKKTDTFLQMIPLAKFRMYNNMKNIHNRHCTVLNFRDAHVYKIGWVRGSMNFLEQMKKLKDMIGAPQNQSCSEVV